MNPLVYGPIYCPVKWELSSNIMGITEDNCRVVLTEDQDNSTNQRSDFGGINEFIFVSIITKGIGASVVIKEVPPKDPNSGRFRRWRKSDE